MFEAYKIAVTMSLTNHVSHALTLMAGDFAKTEAAALALEKRINSIKNTALRGGLMLAAGGGMLAMFKGPLEEARKFQTEVARFSALGLGDVATQDAEKFAKSMNIVGLSARDNMKLVREATFIMGDLGHAKEAVPLLARMKSGIEGVMGEGRGEAFDQMFQAAIKTAELRGSLVDRKTGQIDIPKFHHALDMMTQAYVASGGLVTPKDYLAAIKTGGVSTKMMNDEMFFFGLGHFMQESGGSRTGTAAMSMFQNLAMGRVSKMVARNLESIGVIPHSAVKFGMGPLAAIEPMSIKNASGFVENPFQWVNKTLVPLLEKQGLHGNDLNVKLAQMFGIRTASNLADQFVREEKIADLYVQRAKKAAGVDALYGIGRQTLNQQEIDLRKKWADVLRELGDAVLPLAISGLKTFTPLLRELGEWMSSQKEAVKDIAIGFGVLGAALAGFGSLALIAAGFNAISLAVGTLTGAAGVAALGGALAGLAGTIAVATLAIGGFAVAAHFIKNAHNGDVAAVYPNYHRPHVDDPNIRTAAGEAERARLMKEYGMQPVIHNHFHVDGKEIASTLIHHKPLGPTGINQSALPLPPGMNLGWGGN